MKVLVTGATGFVGNALGEHLATHGHRVVPAVRRKAGLADEAIVGNIDDATDWTAALSGCNAVVHLAARVHVLHETVRDPLAEFRAVNLDGTVQLARQAAAMGVRRLVYVSTIKVNGEETQGRPFAEDDLPRPNDPYAISKWEAEQALQRVAAETGLEVVIVRPPLVHGPGVKGNFLSMMRSVGRGLPLPLASCVNRRSLIALSNFVDLLKMCISHPAAAGEVFLAADGEDLSTPELLRRVAKSLGRRARLFAFPPSLLRAGARLTGRDGIYVRLCGSLQVDAGKARELLGWTPPSSVDAELARTASWFLALNR